MKTALITHAALPFVATQVGQVSVNVDNELELLSDSHWYWWLVRVRGSGNEGFVPAELVELPQERVARLNRQINIKLPYDPTKTPLRVHKQQPRRRVRFAIPELDVTSDSDEEQPSSPISPEESECEAPIFTKLPEPVENDEKKTHEIRIQGTEDDISEQLMAQAL